MDKELKSCPFCGGEEAHITKHFKEDMYNLIHRCKIIGCIKLDWSDKKTLIKAWNTRPESVYKEMWDKLKEKTKEITAYGKVQSNKTIIYTGGVMKFNMQQIEKENKLDTKQNI